MFVESGIYDDVSYFLVIVVKRLNVGDFVLICILVELNFVLRRNIVSFYGGWFMFSGWRIF